MLYKNLNKISTLLCIGIIFGLAITTTLFYNIKSETLGYGEVENLQAVNEYLKGNFVNNFYIFDTPPFERYLLSLSIIIFKDIEIGLRAISLIFGILSVLLVFLVCKRFYKSNITPLLASIILLSSIIHIQLSRYAQYETTLAFFFLLTIYFLFNYIQNKNKKYTLLLGIVIGISISIKFVMIIPIIIVIIYALIKGNIKIKIRPKFTLSIDNSLIKALVVLLVVFFLLWPFSLYTLKTNISISIDGDKGINTSQNIPIFLLSIGKRLSNSLIDTNTNLPIPYNIPIIGLLFTFIVKENPIIVIMFLIGLYSIYKNKEPIDRLFILSLTVFLLLVGLQKSTFGYRQIEIVMPVVAIIAARSINVIKINQRVINLFITILTIVLVLYSVFSGPSYALHYNTLNTIIPSPLTEGYYSEGMRETIDYIKVNCDRALADPFYTFMIEPYYEKIINIKSPNITKVDCVLDGSYGNEKNKIKEFITSNNCILSKKIIKNNIELMNMFKCN